MALFLYFCCRHLLPYYSTLYLFFVSIRYVFKSFLFIISLFIMFLLRKSTISWCFSLLVLNYLCVCNYFRQAFSSPCNAFRTSMCHIRNQNIVLPHSRRAHLFSGGWGSSLEKACVGVEIQKYDYSCALRLLRVYIFIRIVAMHIQRNMWF